MTTVEKIREINCERLKNYYVQWQKFTEKVSNTATSFIFFQLALVLFYLNPHYAWKTPRFLDLICMLLYFLFSYFQYSFGLYRYEKLCNKAEAILSENLEDETVINVGTANREVSIFYFLKIVMLTLSTGLTIWILLNT